MEWQPSSYMGDDDEIVALTPSGKCHMREVSTKVFNTAQSRLMTIGVRGTGPGCGKDTVADMILDRLERKLIPTNRKRFATALKKTVSDYTGIPADVLETMNGKNIVLDKSKILVITDDMLKTTISEYTGKTTWDDSLSNLAIIGLRSKFEIFFGDSINGRTVGQVLQLLGSELRDIFGPSVFVDAVFKTVNPEDVVVISDVRYKQENTAVKERNGIVIFVKRDLLDVNQMAGRSTLHSSERDLDGVDPDYFIDNTGSYEELKEGVNELIDKLFPSTQ
jgi:hypothetical protein